MGGDENYQLSDAIDLALTWAGNVKVVQPVEYQEDDHEVYWGEEQEKDVQKKEDWEEDDGITCADVLED